MGTLVRCVLAMTSLDSAETRFMVLYIASSPNLILQLHTGLVFVPSPAKL